MIYIRSMVSTFLAFVLVYSQFGVAFPDGSPWKSIDPIAAGWSVEKLKAAQKYSLSLKPTAVIIVQNGKVITSWGNVSRQANVASVRKSLLSALYGIAVSDGRIDLTNQPCRTWN